MAATPNGALIINTDPTGNELVEMWRGNMLVAYPISSLRVGYPASTVSGVTPSGALICRGSPTGEEIIECWVNGNTRIAYRLRSMLGDVGDVSGTYMTPSGVNVVDAEPVGDELVESWSGNTLVAFKAEQTVVNFEPFSSLKPWGQVSAGGTNDRTFNLTLRRSSPWVRVRAHIAASAAMSGIAAGAAVTTSDASQYVPSGSNVFSPFVFPSATIPVPTVGTGSSIVPNTLTSEWLNLPSQARTDSGYGYLVIARGYQDASSGGCVSFVSVASDITDVDEIGSWYGIAPVGGNQTTNKAQSFGLTNASYPIWLEFDNGPAKTKTFGVIGDSTIQGWSVENRRIVTTAYRALMDMQAAGRLIDFVNFGWAGSTTAGGTGQPPATISGYWGQFLAEVAAMESLPSVLAFMPTSPNNSLFTSAAGILDTRFWAEYFCDWCFERGVKPILVTPFPRGTSVNPALTAGAETNRRLSCAEIVSTAAAKGAGLVDQSSLLTDLTSPQGGFTLQAWSPEAGSAALHLTLDGSDIILQAWRDALELAFA